MELEEWININKKIPEYGIPVLVFNETYPEEEDGFPLDIMVDVLMKSEDFGNFFCKSEITEITHWMPLPKSPKSDPRRKLFEDK